MVKSIVIDPVTRLEGHLSVHVDIENNAVVGAKSMGEMFRGFEILLRGRDPLDAQQITQRICGVCPISHGTASILAQEDAYGIAPPKNGRCIRNLILGANYIQSHLIHFYQLSALDFVDITAIAEYSGSDAMLQALKDWVRTQVSSTMTFPAAPFLPRYEGTYIESNELNIAAIKHYLDALEMRKIAHQAASLFCGKIPHATALVPGGVTEQVTAKKIAAYKSKLQRLQQFINQCYIPDVLEVAKAFPEYFAIGRGYGNFLVYGAFAESDRRGDLFMPSGVMVDGELEELDINKITEDVLYSFFASPSRPPSTGETTPLATKSGAYSWLKAPRYQGHVMEVGPLARILVAYRKGTNPKLTAMVKNVLSTLNRSEGDLVSMLGRHAARAIECKLVADRCMEWLSELVPGEPVCVKYEVPATGAGVGLTEAPRGALGHWLRLQDKKIGNYQCVVPTTWNCSPRDDQGHPGAIEYALVGTPVADEKNPLEVTRVIRSFDPCLACAVH